MKSRIEDLIAQIESLKAKKSAEVEELRVKLLGKKGEITQLFDEFKTVLPEQKREFGQILNQLKNRAIEKIEELKNNASSIEGDSLKSDLDLSLPGNMFEVGAKHPITVTKEQIIDIFKKFGYTIANGPEIEDDWHVFGALNFPPEHPARDMQDTFFVETRESSSIKNTY